MERIISPNKLLKMIQPLSQCLSHLINKCLHCLSAWKRPPYLFIKILILATYSVLHALLIFGSFFPIENSNSHLWCHTIDHYLVMIFITLALSNPWFKGGVFGKIGVILFWLSPSVFKILHLPAISYFISLSLTPLCMISILFARKQKISRFLFVNLSLLTPLHSYYNDDFSVIATKRDHIRYLTCNKEFPANLDQIHHALPDKFKKLNVDIHISKRADLRGLIPPNAAAICYNTFISYPRVVLAAKEPHPEKTLIHELTHAYQYSRDYYSFLTTPTWKLEAHATYTAQNYSPIKIFQTVFFTREGEDDNYKIFPMFSKYYSKRDRRDYPFAQAQAWYYLEYLGFSEEKFFSPATTLAPRSEIISALSELPEYRKMMQRYDEKMAQLSKRTLNS